MLAEVDVAVFVVKVVVGVVVVVTVVVPVVVRLVIVLVAVSVPMVVKEEVAVLVAGMQAVETAVWVVVIVGSTTPSSIRRSSSVFVVVVLVPIVPGLLTPERPEAFWREIAVRVPSGSFSISTLSSSCWSTSPRPSGSSQETSMV